MPLYPRRTPQPEPACRELQPTSTGNLVTAALSMSSSLGGPRDMREIQQRCAGISSHRADTQSVNPRR